VDETYIGGAQLPEVRKEQVFGMVERDGKAKTYHVPKINRYHVIIGRNSL
jgi:hypothetical protein